MECSAANSLLLCSFAKIRAKYKRFFFSNVLMPDWQIYGQNKGFCELGYNQSVIELFAQLINNTFTCTKLQNTGKITQTLI